MKLLQRKILKPSLLLEMPKVSYPCVRLAETSSAKRRRPNPFQASQILDYIYLGSFSDALQHEEMCALGITHILNAAKEVDSGMGGFLWRSPEGAVDRISREHDSPSFTVHKISICDHSDEDIGRYFGECVAFIQDAHARNGKVLVHCRQGISRSPTIVVAYLMQALGMSLDAALLLVQRKRECVCPNLGFIIALDELSRQKD